MTYEEKRAALNSKPSAKVLWMGALLISVVLTTLFFILAVTQFRNVGISDGTAGGDALLDLFSSLMFYIGVFFNALLIWFIYRLITPGAVFLMVIELFAGVWLLDLIVVIQLIMYLATLRGIGLLRLKSKPNQ